MVTFSDWSAIAVPAFQAGARHKQKTIFDDFASNRPRVPSYLLKTQSEGQFRFVNICFKKLLFLPQYLCSQYWQNNNIVWTQRRQWRNHLWNLFQLHDLSPPHAPGATQRFWCLYWKCKSKQSWVKPVCQIHVKYSVNIFSLLFFTWVFLKACDWFNKMKLLKFLKLLNCLHC